MAKEREQPAEYWMHDEAIGEADIHGERHGIRLRLHRSSERYSESHELVPLTHHHGERIYFHGRPYILVPEIKLTIGVYDKPRGSEIGKVTDSEWTGMEHHEIGNAQAWYYPADHTLILWECYLFDHYRGSDDPTEDQGLKAVWEGFERLLLIRHPMAERIATPSYEPIYDNRPWEPIEAGSPWQRFLRQQGYEQNSGQAFVKKVQGQV